MTYHIIRCNQCATPQYIKSTQKTRKCPRCGNRIKCQKMKVFIKANSVGEASDIVRTMKTPSEYRQRINTLKKKHSKTIKKNGFEYRVLGELITEFVAVFPRAISQQMFLNKCRELGIEEPNFVLDLLDELNQQGLVIKNKNAKGKTSLFFPSLPFKYKKLYVKKPKLKKEFNKEFDKTWKK